MLLAIPLLIVLAGWVRRVRDLSLDIYVACGLAAFAFVVDPAVLAFLARLTPHVVDDGLRAADLRLGLDGYALALWCGRHRWFSYLLEFVYANLFLAIACCWMVERSKRFLWAAALAAIAAIPFYLLVPAVGPAWGAPDSPWHPSASAYLGMPRNCFPSLHFAWALLIVLNARARWYKWFSVVFAVLTALATVVGGEHYCVDVVAAVPFALAVYWLTRTNESATQTERQVAGTRLPGGSTA